MLKIEQDGDSDYYWVFEEADNGAVYIKSLRYCTLDEVLYILSTKEQK